LKVVRGPAADGTVAVHETGSDALTLVDPAFFQSDYVESTHHALVAAIRKDNRDEVARLSRTLLDVGRDLSERWDEHVETRPEGRGEEDGWTNRRPSK